jgi:hypothetical protein
LSVQKQHLALTLGIAASLTHKVDLPSALQRCLRHAWTLWERALCGDPLLVLAPTPAEAADAVAAIVSLIAPLPYCADFRPYLCIHDPAFGALTREEARRARAARHAGGCGGGGAAAAAMAARLGGGGGGDANGGGGGAPSASPAVAGAGPPPVLFGVTNTHFLTALPSFPHVLAVGDKDGAPPPPASATSLLYPPNALRALRRRQQGAAALLSAHSQDLWSSGPHARPLTRPDPDLLAAASGPGGGGAPAARALRRHFSRLTAALLAPFALYLEPGPDGTVRGGLGGWGWHLRAARPRPPPRPAWRSGPCQRQRGRATRCPAPA